MVSFQLPNGRTTLLTIEQVLSLDAQGISFLVASGAGEERNDPFHNSALRDLTSKAPDLPDDYEPGVELEELCLEDQAELSSLGGLEAIFDDGDYLPADFCD